MPENAMELFGLVAVFFCGIVFLGIGIYSFVRKTPMHFWAGSTVSSETITDIKKYNHANGIMWGLFSLLFFADVIIAFFDMGLAGPVLGIGCVVGTFLLVVSHQLIKRHFTVKE